MNEQQRLAYLDAMGIQPWALRNASVMETARTGDSPLARPANFSDMPAADPDHTGPGGHPLADELSAGQNVFHIHILEKSHGIMS